MHDKLLGHDQHDIIAGQANCQTHTGGAIVLVYLLISIMHLHYHGSIASINPPALSFVPP